MLVRYSIIELLMVFEVSAQREHTIVINNNMHMFTLEMLEKMAYHGSCLVAL